MLFAWMFFSALSPLDTFLKFFLISKVIEKILYISGDVSLLEFIQPFFVLIFFNLLAFFISFFQSHLSRKVILPQIRPHIVSIYLNKILNSNVYFYSQKKSGKLHGILNDLVSIIPDLINFKISDFLSYIFYILFYCVFIYMINREIMFLILIWVFLSHWLKNNYIRKKENYSEIWSKLGVKINGCLSDVFQNITTIKSFNTHSQEIRKLNKLYEDASNFEQKLENNASIFMYKYYFGFLFFQIITILLLFRLFVSNKIQASELFFVFFTSQTLFNLTKNYFTSYERYKRLSKKVNYIKKIIDNDEVKVEANLSENVVPCFQKPLTLKNVYFQYSLSSPFLLKNFNLKISPGSITFIKGCSGSGKTTLLNTILGFLSPTKGIIRVVGNNTLCDSFRLNRNKYLIALHQEQSLFDRTIYENITYGTENITFEKVVEATKKSNIYDFIESLPQKFDTMINDSFQLSSGQKKRILISRCFLRHYPLIILDEYSNHLDSESRKKVLANLVLAAKNEGSAILIITHDQYIEEYADNIVTF